MSSKQRMDVQTILIDYLKQNGYDGLFNSAAECGCTIDNLFLCDTNFSECQPAYKLHCPCEADGTHEACFYRDGCLSVVPKKND